jgi:hypothetical protein
VQNYGASLLNPPIAPFYRNRAATERDSLSLRAQSD